MSRDYGRVATSFWTSRSMRAASENAQRLALYLLTGPHSNAIGAYLLPDAYLADDLNWSVEKVTETLSELFRTGFAQRFEDGRHIIICKFLDWNPIENPNVGKAVLKQIDLLPDDPAIEFIFNGLQQYAKHFPSGFETLRERFQKGFEQVPKTGSKQEPSRAEPVPDRTSSVEAKASTAAEAAPVESKVAAKTRSPADEAKAKLYADGKRILGANAGGMITNLLEITEGDVPKAAWMLSDAGKHDDPRSWLVTTMRARAKPGVAVYGMPGMN